MDGKEQTNVSEEPEEGQIAMFSDGEIPTLGSGAKDTGSDAAPEKPRSSFRLKSFREYCSESVLIAFFCFIANYVVYLFGTCLTSVVLTSYDRTAEFFRRSFIFRTFSSGGVTSFIAARKMRLMTYATNARIPKFFSRLFSSLFYVKTRVYGLILLFFGLGTGFVHYFISPIYSPYPNGIESVICGIGAVFLSLFLLFSGNTVVISICESKLLSRLLFRFIGISRSNLNEKDRTEFPYAGACLIGILLGLCTVFLPVTDILLCFLIFLFVMAVIRSPEAGLIFIILLSPVAPISWLVFVSAVTDFVYVYKLICGKRTLHLEFMDIFPVFLILFYVIGGLITFGEKGNILIPAIFISVYLLTVNVCRSRLWYDRAAKSVTILGVLLAVYATLMQFFAGYLNYGFDFDPVIDRTLYSLGALMSSSVLTFFAVTTLFYLIYGAFYSASNRIRFILCVSLILTFVYLILHLTDAAWFALLFSLVLFFLLRNKINALYFLLAAALTPFLPVFRINLLDRISAAFTFSVERLDTWNAVIRMIDDFFLIGGIGSGNGAFEFLYPSYFIGNTENAVHSGSLIMQLLVSHGIICVLFFVLTVFFIIQSAFSYGKDFRYVQGANRMQGYAGLCGIIAAFFWGVGEYIWFDPRCMLFFWILAGITVSSRRSAIAENINNDQIETQSFIFSL